MNLSCLIRQIIGIDPFMFHSRQMGSILPLHIPQGKVGMIHMNLNSGKPGIGIRLKPSLTFKALVSHRMGYRA